MGHTGRLVYLGPTLHRLRQSALRLGRSSLTSSGPGGGCHHFKVVRIDTVKACSRGRLKLVRDLQRLLCA